MTANLQREESYQQKIALNANRNKEASRLYAELLFSVCWHTEHI